MVSRSTFAFIALFLGLSGCRRHPIETAGVYIQGTTVHKTLALNNNGDYKITERVRLIVRPEGHRIRIIEEEGFWERQGDTITLIPRGAPTGHFDWLRTLTIGEKEGRKFIRATSGQFRYDFIEVLPQKEIEPNQSLEPTILSTDTNRTVTECAPSRTFRDSAVRV